jgi:capsular exopolysaccharide synthesis family protein
MPSSDADRPEKSAKVPKPAPKPASVPEVLYPTRVPAPEVPPFPEPVSLPPALTSAPTTTALLLALRRHWLLAICVALLCAAGVGAATWHFLPQPLHTARATVRIAATAPRSVFGAPEGGQDYVGYQRTQVELIKGHRVLTAALSRPEIANLSIVAEQADPIGWLERELKVTFTLGQEFVRLTVSGDRPHELAPLVNAIAEAYVDTFVNTEQNDRKTQLDQMRKALGKFQENIQEQRKLIIAPTEAGGHGDVQGLALRVSRARQTLETVGKQLIDNEGKLREAQAQLKALERSDEQINQMTFPNAEIEAQLRKDPLYADYLLQEANLQALLNQGARASRKGINEPGLRPLRTQIEAMQQLLKTRQNELRPRIIEDMRSQARTEARNRRWLLEQNLLGYTKLQADLSEEVNRLQEDTRRLNLSQDNVDTIRKAISQTEEIAQKLTRELETLNAEVQAPPPSRVSVWEPPVVSQPSNERRQMMAAGMTSTGTFLLVLLAFAWWEFRLRRVNSVEEVVYGLGMQLVGAIPDLPARARQRLIRPNPTRDFHSHSLLTESMDATRTMLLHAAGQEPLRTVMVTSAMGGEGKTSVSCHLAASLARARRRTLLIDCDMRNPSAHRLFDLPRGPGFSELLRGEVDLAEATRPTLLSGLWVIPAGECDPLALQNLAQGDAGPIFEQLRQQYDFVVVDSCPVLPVADSLLIGQHVDGVIFSILRDVSQAPKVYAAYQRLAMLGVRMLGAVVNRAPRGDVYGSQYPYLMRSGRRST